MSEFIYKLNAMEMAALADKPSEHNFKDKRAAVLAYVEAQDAQITQLKEQVDEYAVAIFNALPGPYYMDPPDGGDVSLAEQLKRMAADAAKYRAQLAQPEVKEE